MQRCSQGIRVLLALSIAAYVFYHAGPSEVLQQLDEAQLELMIAAVVVVGVLSVLKAINWGQLLYGALNRRPPLRALMSAYFASCFLGTAVPSSAGTDALRVAYSYRLMGGHLATHAASTVMLNGINWFVACALGTVSAAALYLAGGLPLSIEIFAWLLVAVAAAVPVGYLLLKYSRGFITCLLRRMPARAFRFRHALRRFIDAVLVFENAHVNLVPILAVAGGAIMYQALSFVLTAASIDVHLPWSVWMILVPLSSLIGILPLSIMGFGATQAGQVMILVAFGVPEAQALVVSMLMALWNLTINVGLGGCVFVRSSSAQKLLI